MTRLTVSFRAGAAEPVPGSALLSIISCLIILLPWPGDEVITAVGLTLRNEEVLDSLSKLTIKLLFNVVYSKLCLNCFSFLWRD